MLLAGCEPTPPLPFYPNGGVAEQAIVEATAHWGIASVSRSRRRGSIAVYASDEPPIDKPDDARGWGSRGHFLCYPHIGIVEGWASSWQTVAHELGHAAGLDHHDDPRNIMHAELYADSVEYTDKQAEAIHRLSRTLWRWCP